MSFLLRTGARSLPRPVQQIGRRSLLLATGIFVLATWWVTNRPNQASETGTPLRSNQANETDAPLRFDPKTPARLVKWAAILDNHFVKGDTDEVNLRRLETVSPWLRRHAAAMRGSKPGVTAREILRDAFRAMGDPKGNK